MKSHKQGFHTSHNLSLSGGNAQTTYRISGNYRDVQGIARNTGFDRINLRANLVQKALNDRLTFQANISSTNENSQKSFEEAFRYATIYNPTSPIRDVNNPAYDRWDGYAQQVLFDYYNPVAIIEQKQGR